MVRSVQKIEQELEAIATQVSDFGQALRQAYRQYLTLLGESAKKQLVLASYQICTQSYPDAFLELSLSQRQSLQQGLRQVGDRTCQELPQLLDNPLPPPESPKPPSSEAASDDPTPPVLEITAEALEAIAAASEANTAELPPEALEALTNAAQSASKDIEQTPPEELPQLDFEARSPEVLIGGLKFLEQHIDLKLQTLSIDANELLHQSGILPQALPAKLLEMAMQAEDAVPSGSHGANLLNLIVEAEPENSDKENTVIHVAAIRLRLSELEFSDPMLNAERNKIRQLLQQVQKLYKKNQKRQREWAIAQAEAAWRSSWFE